GEKIVARECLVDGNVQGRKLEEFFTNRARFISSTYKGYTEQDYYQKTLPEFDKIQQIPTESEINLWFEDDLFCQVNFWFVLHLLNQSNKDYLLYLVRPKVANEYGFGGMKESELISAYENRSRISALEFQQLAKLWRLYQENKHSQMLELAITLKDRFPFLHPAIKAHIDRIPRKGQLGRPKEVLLQIMNELKTDQFGPIFKVFCKRESIYGFGDLQVKRLLDELKNNH
ncbi:DUF1835 domain-containing protein, partial [Xanthovirga aplysinae]|uniref:DUF1835 domain-containing protein n=1 Tax=Xanthovirga aplysinae TaxID=2529853 RepID=UPI0016570317